MDPQGKRHRVLGGIVIGRRHTEASRVGFIWGLMIAAVGVALLLDHMGFVRVGSLWRFWPLILIGFGIGHVLTPSSRVWGLILIVVGAVFQLNNLGITHLGIGDLWPLAIIAVGLLLMWGAMKPPIVLSGSGSGDSSADVLNAVAVFGGCERRINSKTFRGGRSTSVFGGVELDFRDADMEGDEAILELNCVFGGVEIRVPPNWTVHSTSVPVLGGYSDKTHAVPIVEGVGPKRKTLVITGAIVFGGVEISN